MTQRRRCHSGDPEHIAREVMPHWRERAKPAFKRRRPMSLGMIVLIILVVMLFGGGLGQWGGRGPFYGTGYYGGGGLGLIVVIVLILLLVGRL
jgi:hypothetical protein